MCTVASDHVSALDALSLSGLFAFGHTEKSIVLFGGCKEGPEQAVGGLVSELWRCGFIFGQITDADRDGMSIVVGKLSLVDRHLFGYNTAFDLDSAIRHFGNGIQEMALDPACTRSDPAGISESTLTLM